MNTDTPTQESERNQRPDLFAKKRLGKYLIAINDQSDARSRTFALDNASLASDIVELFKPAGLKDFLRYIAVHYGMATKKEKEEIIIREKNVAVDSAREREMAKRRRNAMPLGGLVMGQVSWSDVHYLTKDLPDSETLATAAVVYVLIKQGALLVDSYDTLHNAPLVYAIKKDCPQLHIFLTTDHSSNFALSVATTTYERVSNDEKKKRNRTLASIHNRIENLQDDIPDDLTFSAAWENLLNVEEFAAIAKAFDVFLRYVSTQTINHNLQILNAQPMGDRYSKEQWENEQPPRLIIEPYLLKQRVNGGTITPCVFGNPLSSPYNTTVVTYSRVAIGSTINRPDMWTGWRGDHDRRYYADHKGYATRGSRNKIFGWACKQIDQEFNINPFIDANPYTLLHMALNALEKDRPYAKKKESRNAWDRLLDIPSFDPQIGDYVDMGYLSPEDQDLDADPMFALKD